MEREKNMSHAIEYYSYAETESKGKIEAILNDRVRHKTYEEGGHGLNSPIRWIDRVFDSEQLAHDYIEKIDTDRYDQLAVKFRDYPRNLTSKTLESIDEKIKKKTKEKEQFIQDSAIFHRASEKITCKECSTVYRLDVLKKYNERRNSYRMNSCPICGNDFRSATTLARIKAYDDAIEDLKKQRAAEVDKIRAKNIKSSKIMWLVKIEYHI